MQIVDEPNQLVEAMEELTAMVTLGKEGGLSSTRPALIDRFLQDATEVDVDALRDINGEFLLGSIMEHIEEAGVHSGDSACILPPQTLSSDVIATIIKHTKALAENLEVVGLINIQFAVQDDNVYIIEANPRASRTVPFVAKATGIPIAKIATRLMLGETFESLRSAGIISVELSSENIMPTDRISVKAPVFPFARFPKVDAVLGPEMRSTGEVMGISPTFGTAFYKAQISAGMVIPSKGVVFISVADRDKENAIEVARMYAALGFRFAATSGTASAFVQKGIPVDYVIAKVGDEYGNDAVDLIANGKIDLVINTPMGRSTRRDGQHIRIAATKYHVPCVTTIAAARALASGIAQWEKSNIQVASLQKMHENVQLTLESNNV